MAKLLKVTANSSFAATNIDGQLARFRHQLEELIAVEPVVTVGAARSPDPVDPLFGVRVPVLAEWTYLIGC